ncbi:MAG TPA: hypothetical protein VMV84_03105 [Dehalococcoidales bacterium]|nr:hypothetical protein [Dehalococcoidales bacterium]
MSKARRKKVSFIAKKKEIKPVRVKFYTSKGEKVSFKATKEVKKPVKVEFYARKKKK